MYKYAIWELLFLMAVAAGCSDAEEEIPPPFNHIHIDACIQDGSETRTSMSGSKASFTSGDVIGVYETLTGRSNVSYSYNGTAWTPSSVMYWQNGTSNHTFYAYYPYNATSSGTVVTIPKLSTQTIKTTVSPSADLLVSGPQTQKRSASVGLTFTHAYTLIQLNVKMGLLGLLKPYDLQRITIQGGNPSGNTNRYGIVNVTGVPTQIGYNLATGAFQAATNDTQSYAQSFYSEIEDVSILYTVKTLYVFILPGTYTTPAPSVTFKLSLGGIVSNSKTANFSTASTITFLPATKYTYDVTIGLGILGTRSSDDLLDVTIVAQEPVPYDDEVLYINQPF